MTFSEGDIVSKKTGGPLMTVEDTRTDEFISCVWFDETTLQRHPFDPATLHKWILATE